MTQPLREVVVLGLGSPFGDDRVGWVAVDRLTRSGVRGAFQVRDGVDVLLALEGRDDVIVIDAATAAGCPGRVARFEWPSDELTDDRLWSTHGLGLAAALRMAAALGRLPRRLIIYTIEADAAPPGDSLSRAAETGIERLVDKLLTTESSLIRNNY